ncbi:hypothetical protein ACFVAQ_16700 [Streptomyces sp. NPDC057651]|uniref:hypothetical protein n=1 Tax=Streptomyces sp. NPDC057651 TaxID=3346194 RepID=UPI00369DE7DE
MNVGGMLLGKKITKRYPRRGDLQLLRLEAAASFACSRCTQTKTARLVAVQGDALFCNGCYGRMDAEGQEPEQTSSGEASQRSTASVLSSAALDAELSAAEAEELARIVVEESDGGLPHSVVATRLSMQWMFHVRAEHLWHGTCPVPAEMAERAPQTPLSVTYTRAGQYARVLGVQQSVELHRDGGQPFLRGLSWQRFVLPGTRVSARWDLWKKLRFAYTPLDKPVVVADTVVRYAYDPRIMTRDLATLQVRVDGVEELLLITLRELGYLDEQGRAFLPDEALVRNTAERGHSQRPPVKRIRAAIRGLLSRGVLTRELGSLGAGGMLHYPLHRGERPVQLLCYTPAVRVADSEDLRDTDGHGAHNTSAHRVAGHLMRIGHLGKEASAEARAAYRHDHQQAGLVGPHELPWGYTYVREYERGV